jgi:hypothetical protein
MLLVPEVQTFEDKEPLKISAVYVYSICGHIHTVSAFKVFTPGVSITPLSLAPLFMPAGT